MKSENRQRQNPSSKVLMGLAAVGATGSASGALVQINLISNTITAGGGNQLNADLTGDGVSDFQFRNPSNFGAPGYLYSGRFTLFPGGSVVAYSAIPFNNYYVRVGVYSVAGPGASVSGSFVISFDGASLGLSGAVVSGLLQVTAGGQGSTRGVTLNSLVFDDGTGMPVSQSTDISGATLLGSTENGVYTGGTVPEPSSLALLALGAGGLLTRRQRKKAA